MKSLINKIVKGISKMVKGKSKIVKGKPNIYDAFGMDEKELSLLLEKVLKDIDESSKSSPYYNGGKLIEIKWHPERKGKAGRRPHCE
jgi:hypothetical protein